jgi:N-methylhydantoinase A
VSRRFQIGCDVGGTFTDVAAVDATGEVLCDKSDTTREDLTAGMLSALELVAGRAGLSLDDLLAATDRFVVGTTVVTNSIAELRGSRVGLLTTKGHGDVLRIARSARNAHRDHHRQLSLPQIVPRERVIEVDERVDKTGTAVVPLTEAEARRAIDAVLAQDVESVAISLLWGFANPAHEELLAGILASEHPDLYVSVASRLHPVMREYERTITTVLNSFTGLEVVGYTRRIENALSERGLRCSISFMQGFGGTLSAQEARERPIALVDSGPAGGVIGAGRLGASLGVANVIAADMGGTSFDVAVLPEGRVTVTQRVMLGERFLTGLSKIDVHPVGAGGGSIGWIDARGMPRVGPHSAGAHPGPACYGQGGTEPTVTDAAVALGIIDPERFLGGRRRLDVDAASHALMGVFGQALDVDLEHAAAGVYRLVAHAMSNAIRATTVERGRDPRRFALVAYGGALGIFAADIAREMGIARVVLPAQGPVFSAYGLLATDDVRVGSRSQTWVGGDASDVEATLRELEREGIERLRAAGFSQDRIEVDWEGEFKFAGQLWEIAMPISRSEGLTEADLQAVQEAFPGRYEEEFGRGTAWKGTPVILLGVRVTVRGLTEKFTAGVRREQGVDAESALLGTRELFRPEEDIHVTARVFDGVRLGAGCAIEGPAIVEHELTTIQVPPGFTLTMDEYGNGVLDDERQPTSAASITEEVLA